MYRFFDSDFAAIDLGHLADYLLSKGWQLQEQVAEKATIWDSPDRKTEIWVPLRRDFRDFKIILSSTFEALEKIESRPISAILRDMSFRWADINRFRVSTGMFGAGSIPLPNGIRLLEAARDAIAASSRWLTEPKAAYYTRPHEKVSEFLRHLQMGQTEVGSFVLTVISPLTHGNAQFSREAMAQVYQAISSAKTFAEKAIETNTISIFSDAVAQGVNANLCDALIELGSLSPDGAMEVRFTWSPREGLPPPGGDVILVSEMNLRTLDPAAKFLRRLEPDIEIELTGLVRDMTDRSADDRESDLILVAQVDDRRRRVRLNVRGPQRQIAIAAFDTRTPIKVRGTLDRSGVPFVLNDLQSVEAVEASQMVDLIGDLFVADD